MTENPANADGEDRSDQFASTADQAIPEPSQTQASPSAAQPPTAPSAAPAPAAPQPLAAPTYPLGTSGQPPQGGSMAGTPQEYGPYGSPQPPAAGQPYGSYQSPLYGYPTAAQPTQPQQPYGPAAQVGYVYTGVTPQPTGPGGPTGAGARWKALSEPVRRRVVAGAAALVIAVGGGVVGGVVGYTLHPNSSGNPLQVSANTGNGTAAPVIDRSSLASIAAALQPAIVDITTSQGEGSGVVISADGNIVTNNHVISGAGNGSITVTFNSGQQVPATVVGADQLTDLAVLKVNASGLSFATWGDSDSVQVGDTVLAMGSPLGLQGSVTAGIVSALHRTITEGSQQGSQSDTSSSTTIGDAIQTDAPINPGNSGGALVDTNGHVIGINSAIATSGSDGNIGVGFAISSNKAKAVADALIAGQKVGHPYLGVQISDDPSGGAHVDQVVSGSPAAQAGLVTGDAITKVGSRTIRGAEDLIGAIQSSTVGAQLQMTVRHNGADKTVTVTVGQQ
jgi:putative serine protease PepD